MSNFNCKICNTPILENDKGYYTSCKHYPLSERNILSPNMEGRIDTEKLGEIRELMQDPLEMLIKAMKFKGRKNKKTKRK